MNEQQELEKQKGSYIKWSGDHLVVCDAEGTCQPFVLSKGYAVGWERREDC